MEQIILKNLKKRKMLKDNLLKNNNLGFVLAFLCTLCKTVCPLRVVDNAVAGYIRINDDIYLYAIVEGVESGQPCCPHHLSISDPLQQHLHVNNTHIMYYMPTPVRDSHSSQV